jgi:membrane protein DedA with SNARE-associated domain
MTTAEQVTAMPSLLRELLASEVGLLALFGVFVLEGAMLMYFMPSELIVPGALALLGTSIEWVLAVIGVAVLGATSGQYALFTASKRGGRQFVLENRFLRLDESRLDRFEGWFERWGPAVVFASNTLLFTRGMVTIPAGLAGMDDRRFLLLSAAGTLVFESALAALFVYGVGLL